MKAINWESLQWAFPWWRVYANCKTFCFAVIILAKAVMRVNVLCDLGHIYTVYTNIHRTTRSQAKLEHCFHKTLLQHWKLLNLALWTVHHYSLHWLTPFALPIPTFPKLFKISVLVLTFLSLLLCFRKRPFDIVSFYGWSLILYTC